MQGLMTDMVERLCEAAMKAVGISADKSDEARAALGEAKIALGDHFQAAAKEKAEEAMKLADESAFQARVARALLREAIGDEEG